MKKRRTAALPAELSGLLAWLKERGATFDDTIELRTTSSAGVGLFAKRDLSAGETLVSVPQSCALTAGVALASELGVAVAAAAEKLGCAEACTAELVTWLFMCRGRTEPGHAWHAYLVSLPAAPDPASWPEAQRAELDGTTVGGAVDEALQHAAQCLGVVAQLATEVPELASIAEEDLLWARGMLLSRQFPSHLGGENSTGSAGRAAGCLLPLLDFLNHDALGTPVTQALRYVQPAKRTAALGCVALTSGALIQKGAEIFISYGDRPNEELLYAHGFCIRDNPMDDVALALVLDGGTFGGGGEQEDEPFRIRRQTAGGIPSELLRAAAAAAAKQGEEGDAGMAAIPPVLDAPLEVGAALEVGADECMLLHSALLERLQAALPSVAADRRSLLAEGLLDQGAGPADELHHGAARRRQYVAMYRQGQREVLLEAVTWLEGLLQAAADGESEGEGEGESEGEREGDDEDGG